MRRKTMLFKTTITMLAVCALAVRGKEYPRVEYAGGVTYGITKVVHSNVAPQLEITDDTTYFNGAWIQNFSGNIGIDAILSPHLSLHTGISAGIWHTFQTVRSGYYFATSGRKASRDIPTINVQYRFGDPGAGHTPLKITAGFFDYRYESDAKSLGLYLFNSEAYPGIVYAAGERKIFGLGLHSDLPAILSHDVLAYTDPYSSSDFDVSFAYVACLTPGPLFNVGAGIALHRILKDDPDLTDRSTYSEDSYSAGEIARIDSGLSVRDLEPTIYYSKAGTKVMLRAAFDPSPLLEQSAFFGPSDLKVYAEAAILGLKDYPNSYESPSRGYTDILERIPVMGGINVPTHPIVGNGIAPLGLAMFLIGTEPDSVKVLEADTVIVPTGEFHGNYELFDTTITQNTEIIERGLRYKPQRLVVAGVLSAIAGAGTFLLERRLGRELRLDRIAVEVEYYGTPYRNVLLGDRALPVLHLYQDRADEDNIRWAVHFEKSFMDRVTFSGRVACDHLKLKNEYGWWAPEEIVERIGEWYWATGLSVSF
ncbi:MAG: hypothetical protein GF418_09290 [Chitinivibrionales bacterium]|nr:hypothetical protein [Chitinivibrionales bacterium]MBD3395802.1 hypothetical protein [Chitinivibrionales bacterium]